MRARRRSSSIRISPTPRSSSVADTMRAHSFRLDDPRHCDDLVTAHHERPAFAVGARDLCVDEHVLDLPRAAGEPVARTPPPYLKPCERGLDAPIPPRDLAAEVDRSRLEPEPVVLAHGLHAAAEVDPPRRCGCVEQLGERAGHGPPLVEGAQKVLARAGMDAAEQWQHLVADQAAHGARVRRVRAPGDPPGGAVLLGLLAPQTEERADDAVLAARLDPRRRPTRDEAVEDRLDLVGKGVTGRPQELRLLRVPELAQLGLRRPGRAHHTGGEAIRAPAGVLVRLRSPQAMVDVQRRNRVAELPERMEEAGRVGAARDEAEHGLARRDQLVPADVRLDPLQELQEDSVTGALTRRSRAHAAGATRPRARGLRTRRGCTRDTCARTRRDPLPWPSRRDRTR